MKQRLLIAALCLCCRSALAQTNYLDNYLGTTVTITAIATSSNSLSQPPGLNIAHNGSATSIPVQNLSAGIYFIQISDGENIYTNKFIKDCKETRRDWVRNSSRLAFTVLKNKTSFT